MSKRWKLLVSEIFRKLEENLELTAKQEALPAAVASNAMIHRHLAGWFIVSIETWEKWKRITKLRQDLNEGQELLKTSSLLPSAAFFLCVSSCLVYLYSPPDYFYTTEILHCYPEHHCLSVWVQVSFLRVGEELVGFFWSLEGKKGFLNYLKCVFPPVSFTEMNIRKL